MKNLVRLKYLSWCDVSDTHISHQIFIKFVKNINLRGIATNGVSLVVLREKNRLHYLWLPADFETLKSAGHRR